MFYISEMTGELLCRNCNKDNQQNLLVKEDELLVKMHTQKNSREIVWCWWNGLFLYFLVNWWLQVAIKGILNNKEMSSVQLYFKQKNTCKRLQSKQNASGHHKNRAKNTITPFSSAWRCGSGQRPVRIGEDAPGLLL